MLAAQDVLKKRASLMSKQHCAENYITHEVADIIYGVVGQITVYFRHFLRC